ncbi:MAG: Rieske (2Fe-2S) protein [Bryobacterales bacterium]
MQTEPHDPIGSAWLASLASRRRAFLTFLSTQSAIAPSWRCRASPSASPPLFQRRKQEWRDVGALADFQAGATRVVSFQDASPEPWAGVTAKTAAWVRRESSGELIAFSVNCTHLGCPVRWIADSALFMCPCHGGVYYADGEVAAGPPPKPLPRYPVRTRAGRVEVRTSPVPITTA